MVYKIDNNTAIFGHFRLIQYIGIQMIFIAGKRKALLNDFFHCQKAYVSCMMICYMRRKDHFDDFTTSLLVVFVTVFE